ncbi:MAG: Grx4 family monothiol glutaredoxin [Deltaproteobacteria bacterium]|nr:Grx4 family monothiol glutaredoxin [Deltaproteobacteria bacterium]
MRDVQKEIDELVKSKPVVLFMKGTPAMPMCGFSARTVEALKACGVGFSAVNVLQDPDIREGIKEYGQWPTIPQLYVKGELVGGCDITVDLYQRGELEPMLKAAAGESQTA